MLGLDNFVAQQQQQHQHQQQQQRSQWHVGNPVGKQQMNTPDDPVIHSPSSSHSAMFGSNSSFLIQSPEGQDNSEEARRRQKMCRVCGDHATGYNFNVITCESCKAFFRRNALRPKEFKCPYSDDCEINAVSRRFCQKCRLRKCFQVGMKKEWILNDDQLRRRKNSRLNSTMKGGGGSSSQYGLQPHELLSAQHQTNAALARNQQVVENVINTVKNELPDQQNANPQVPQPSLPDFRLPLQQQYNLQHFLQSANASAPPQTGFGSTSLPQRRPTDVALNPVGGTTSNIASLMSPQLTSPQSPATLIGHDGKSSRSVVDLQQLMRSNFMNLPTEEYNRLINARMELKHSLGTGTSSQSHSSYPQAFKPYGNGIESLLPSATSRHSFDAGAPNNVATPTGLSSPAGSNNSLNLFPFFDMSPGAYRRMEETIHDALISSPGESINEHPRHVEFKDVCHGDVASYQLNSSELCELDVVRNAYGCMDEPLGSDTKASGYLKKKDHTPADIMNIMDITMRRFVKMTKKLPAFNTLSQDGKLSLLKAAMIQMLTMRGVTRFDPKKMCWNTNVTKGATEISCDMFDKLNDRSQKGRFIKFCLKMDESIRKNDVAINLIGLVILFRNTNVVTTDHDKHLSRKYHTLYGNLLRRYIESVHGLDATRILESIPEALQELQDISSNAETLFVGRVRPGETEQLPTEFFRTKTEDVPSLAEPEETPSLEEGTSSKAVKAETSLS